jgi:TRAP transporter TAXI family solute receptor
VASLRHISDERTKSRKFRQSCRESRSNVSSAQGNPGTTSSKIPGGTYRALTADYNTLGLFNFVIGRTDLSDDLVYQLVKTVYGNQRELVKRLPSAVETVVENVDKNTFLPFHPGAVRYYREIGISIRESLVPTN